MTQETKTAILKKFAKEMETIYDTCTDFDSEDGLVVNGINIEPETQMEILANTALEDILSEFQFINN